jgi:hypothetical protein
MTVFRDRILRDLIFGAVAFTAVFTARNAFACGASTGGVAGLSACSVDEHEEEIRPKWRVGESYSYTSTGIRFDDVRPDQTRLANIVTLETMPFPQLDIQLGAGVIDSQVMMTPGARYNSPDLGVVMVLGGSYRLLDAKGARPFVLATVGLTMSSTRTEMEGGAQTRAQYTAFDARGGGAVGWNIAHVLTPYVLGRVFGGPVYWMYQNQKETGTDVYHYQLGGGLGIQLRNGFDIFAEGVPLGELGFSAGIGFSF